jgi:hypothetical protein
VGVYLRQIWTSGACGIQPEQLDLSAILDAVSDPVRRSIVLRLAEYGSANCSNSYEWVEDQPDRSPCLDR